MSGNRQSCKSLESKALCEQGAEHVQSVNCHLTSRRIGRNTQPVVTAHGLSAFESLNLRQCLATLFKLDIWLGAMSKDSEAYF